MVNVTKKKKNRMIHAYSAVTRWASRNLGKKASTEFSGIGKKSSQLKEKGREHRREVIDEECENIVPKPRI